MRRHIRHYENRIGHRQREMRDARHCGARARTRNNSACADQKRRQRRRRYCLIVFINPFQTQSRSQGFFFERGEEEHENVLKN